MVGIKLHGRVGEKGQIVIPKPIREQLGIQPNTELVFDLVEEKIVIRKERSDVEIVEEFVNMVKKKKNFSKKIDWSKEVYSQFD